MDSNLNFQFLKTNQILDFSTNLKTPFNRQDLLQIIVDKWTSWLQSHVNVYLMDDVYQAIVNGLDKATRIRIRNGIFGNEKGKG